MDFTSLPFLAFLGAMALLYRLIPRSWRCTLLVAASYCFYWLGARWYIVLLLGATLAAYFAGKSKSRLLAMVSLLISILVFLKAMPLFQHGWLLPLGISYYTFKLAGYLIDIYWGGMEPEQRLMPFLAYSSFFPQIVSGPIQRPESFLPQVEQAPLPSFARVMEGIMRILLGFFKKFVVADNLGEIVNYVYAHLNSHPGPTVLLAFYCYPLQLFADFSGLTDIANGAAILFGIEAPENFNAPFVAVSPGDYWRRWHITLTQWITDYVFTPLRMRLRTLGTAGLILSLFANMILIGLWHGFRWNFALFGAIHAAYLSVESLTQKARKRLYKRSPLADRITDYLGPLMTFHLVAIGIVFWRASNLAAAGNLFAHLFDGPAPISSGLANILDRPGHSLWFLAGAYTLMECLDYLRRRFWGREWMLAMPRWGRWSLYGCVAMTCSLVFFLMLISGKSSSPFLYAIF